MKRSIYIITVSLILSLQTRAQSSIDSVLSKIASNNKTLKANESFWEAKKLKLQTGLTLSNPIIDYDYLNGTPVGAGNQTDFAITQAFDFPSAYKKKKELSNEKMGQAQFQLLAERQDLLLKAKIICNELVYRNKLQIEIDNRKLKNEKMLADFQTMLNNGDGNILDVNKAKLQLIEISAIVQKNTSSIQLLNQKLTELNGGIVISFDDTKYSDMPMVMSFEDLEGEIEINDPMRKYLEQQKIIGLKQVALSKAMALPKFEAGYHYQGILGQRYNGIHVGVSVPLWESKNVVKAGKAELAFSDLKLTDHKNEHYFEIKQKYEKQRNLRLTLLEYEKLFSSLNSSELLDKALKLGQISTIEYFLEVSYFYSAMEKYLLVENQYYQTVAELNKYKL